MHGAAPELGACLESMTRFLPRWCRVIVAVRLLEEPIYTLEQAALRLDFPSGTALRNMLVRYTGLRPREIRENGGIRCALHVLRRELGACVGAGAYPPAET